MQVYVHEAIIDHSEGIKNSFSASVAQVVQNAVRQGQAETLAKQIEMQEQMTEMQDQMTAMQGQMQGQMTAMQGQMQDQMTAMQGQMQDQMTAMQGQMQEQMTAMQGQMQDQMTAMQGQMQGQMTAISENARISAGNDRRLAGQGRLRLLRKTVAGHPERKPTEKVDEALLDVDVPFPVGAFPPRLKFFPLEGLTGAEISGLTHAQIDDLAWFYNVEFGLPSKYDRVICGSHLLGCRFACRTAAACEVCL
jgi:DNA polymerase III gamma/tau subunit